MNKYKIMTSNYSDNGWTDAEGAGYTSVCDENNSFIDNKYIPPQDLYTAGLKCGVYLCDGVYNSFKMYNVLCSCSDITKIGLPAAVDDAYFVYPGFGFQLYSGTSYGGYNSNLYYNNSDQVKIYHFGGTNWVGTRIYYNGYNSGTTSTTCYPANYTRGIKIFYKGKQIFCNVF
jgi:hypothetical protein